MPTTPIRAPAIPRLLLAYGVSQFGDLAGEMALAVAVYTQTASATAVAAVWIAHRALLAWLAPWLVCALARRPRRGLLSALSTLQAALFATLAVGVSHGLVVIVPLLVADGLLAPAARALSRTALVAVAGTGDHLRDANARFNVVCTVNGLLAPVAGGVLVAAAGPRTVLSLDAASFLVAAAATAVLTVGGGAPAPATLRAALGFARSHAIVGRLLIGDTVWTLFISAITPIEVAFVCGSLGGGPSALGAVLTAWGGGMVVGATAAARLPRVPVGVLLAFAAAAPGIACLGMAASHAIAAVAIWSAVGGVGNGVYGMAFVTALQQRTPPRHQACVNALYDAAGSIAPGIGFAVAGVVAASVSPRAVYVLAGLGALAALAAAAAGLWRADWSQGGGISSPPPMPAGAPERIVGGAEFAG